MGRFRKKEFIKARCSLVLGLRRLLFGKRLPALYLFTDYILT